MDILTYRKNPNQLYATHDEWYWERYWHHVQEIGTEVRGYSKKAYLATEEEYNEKLGCYRFTDYNSFRQGKYRKYSGGNKTTKSVRKPGG